MSDKQKKGYFITFEGADGSGKTTQIKKLAEYLNSKNIKNIVTRDPGGTELGSMLREILLHHKGYIAPDCELLLYMADRAQHINEKIIPALEEGTTVLCDRFIDSSVAYQGYGRGLDINKINELNSFVIKNTIPDVTILLDVDTEVAAERIVREKDRFELEAQSFHKKLREGYLKIAEQNTFRFIVVDANDSPENVFKNIVQLLEKKNIL